MLFGEFASYLEKLEGVASRNEMTVILSEIFKKLAASEIDKASYLLLGGLAPEFKGVVFGIAEKMMVRIIANAYELEVDKVDKDYKNRGDLGEAVFSIAGKTVGTGNLSLGEVYKALWDIATDKGEESQERKIEKTSTLLRQVDPVSAKFVVRITLGKLRLGFSDKTVLDALSYFEKGDKSGKGNLEVAYNVLPDVGFLAKRVKEVGIKKTTSTVSPRVGYPLLPMLAARLKSPTEMIKKMGSVFVEPKFDGLRIQLHYSVSGFEDGGTVKAFTRKPNEVSWMFPELSDLSKYLNAKKVILDTEAVGVDETRKALANFQTTMTRRRKHDIEEMSKKVSIRFNVFDIMLLNNEGLIDRPYKERREILTKTVKNGSLIEIVGCEETSDPDRINELMHKELGNGLEGIIVKKTDAGYVAGRTGYRWVKMKEKESQKAKLADTVDAVVMGYYKGRGKRVGFGLGGFLVGIRSGDDKILTLTKIGTGLTDDQFRDLKKRLRNLEVGKKPTVYGEVDKTILPDIWVEPGLVTEIAADEITKSDKSSSGYSLRFPRLVRFRDDKDWISATTQGELKKLYNLQ